VDGRPNWRNKAAFLNFSGAVWTLPKTTASTPIGPSVCLENKYIKKHGHPG